MAETWARLRELFEATADLDPAAQAARLDAECGNEPTLRRAVERLLAMDRDAGRFLDEPLVFGDAVAVPRAPGCAAPETIGPYRVLRALGSGGLGSVVLAARDDGAYARRVAIKLVRPDLDSPDLARRLEAERQILAGLAHPNIAELFDGGTTDDGRPYVVMEYVDGLSIDVFCDRRRLSIDERVDLFLDVCSAVEHAHRNLVIHRDLKPANILVDAEGVPKLLDFGIAKVLNPTLGRAELAPTATWMQMMTPHYASPEQLRGEPLTTTSDVYSLGVLLYRLVSGRLPKRFDELSPFEVGRWLDSGEPPPASVRLVSPEADEDDVEAIARRRSTEPRQLARRLSGDLDAILAKSLRPSPHQRYGSVEALAEDLRRLRSGRPVVARRGTWRYRTGKLLRRHRAAVAAVVLALAVIGLAAGMVIDRAAEAARQRDRAEVARARQRVVFDLLLGTLGAADPRNGPGDARTVREALEWSGPRLRRELADRPEWLADALHASGEIYANLGLWRRAAHDLERAVELRRALGDGASIDLASTLALAGLVHARLGDEALARRASAEAVTRFAAEPEADPRARVVALNRRVAVLCWFGDLETADAPSRRALALARALDPPSPADLAEAWSHRGSVALGRGEHAAAADRFGRAVDLLEALWGADHPVITGPLSNRGSALRRLGDIDAAEAVFRRVLAIQVESLGEDHPDLAPTLNNLARVARDRGRPDAAEVLYSRARAVFARQVEAGHPRLFFLDLQIARARLDQGRAAEVAVALDRLLPEWSERLGAEHPWVNRGLALQAEALAVVPSS